MGDLRFCIKIEGFALARGHLVDLILNAGRQNLYLCHGRVFLGGHHQQRDTARDTHEQA
nr:hypothetical protein [Microtetraspora sp. AC03309]